MKPLTEIAPRNAVVAKVDGELVDLTREAPDGADVSFPEPASQEALHVLRHSAAHVLAQAVLREFPGAGYAIGPPIEDGFYYDFDLPRALTEEDLATIQGHIDDIVRADQAFTREELSRTEAIKLFTE